MLDSHGIWGTIKKTIKKIKIKVDTEQSRVPPKKKNYISRKPIWDVALTWNNGHWNATVRTFFGLCIVF